MYVPINWKARMKDYKFYNEKFFGGINNPNSENLKNIKIKLHVRKNELFNETNRLLYFTFIMKFLPNCGEFAFDGECTIESPNQNTIGLLLNASDSFRKRVEFNIFKKAYPLAGRIAKEEGILIPTSNGIIKVIQDNYKEKIEAFDKMAEAFNRKYSEK